MSTVPLEPLVIVGSHFARHQLPNLTTQEATMAINPIVDKLPLTVQDVRNLRTYVTQARRESAPGTMPYMASQFILDHLPEPTLGYDVEEFVAGILPRGAVDETALSRLLERIQELEAQA